MAQRAMRADESAGVSRLGLRLGHVIYRLRWWIIGFWIVVLFVSAPFAVMLPSALNSGGYTFSGSESIREANLEVSALHHPSGQLDVVFHSTTTLASDPSFQSEIQAFDSRARSFAGVTGIVNGGVGQDGKTVLRIVNFDVSAAALENDVGAFTALLPPAQPAKGYVTGDTAVFQAFNDVAQQDIEKADAAALPIALVVLLFVFGSLVAGSLPIVLAIVTLPVALAEVYLIAQHVSMNFIVLSIASIIGLGLSIDYSLFLTRRFREELGNGFSPEDAAARTLATSGEAIVFSALTVALSFCAMLLLDIPIMTSMGLGGIAVVLTAMLGAITLLISLFGVLGHRIDALSLRRRKATANASGARPVGLWHRWAMIIMRYPIPITVVVAALLIGLGWPVLSMRVGVPSLTSLPTDVPARQGLDILYAQYPALSASPIDIMAQTPDGGSVFTPANLTKIDTITQWLARQPHVTSVSSLMAPPTAPGATQLTPAQLIALYTSGAYLSTPGLAAFVANTTASDITLITVIDNTKVDSPAGVALIDHLRQDLPGVTGGLTTAVGGLQAITLDFNNYLYGNFPRALIFMLAATFLLLMILFRSIVLPLKAVIMNVLSIGVAFGALVAIFQWGWLSSVLGFTSEGFVESTVPVIEFCILFGLSMDYEVFLLTRIREEWLRSGNNRYAVAQGLEKTGGVITSAALILCIVTGAITLTSLISAKEVGLGMTIAVLVDATIIRSLLVPATMRLIGRWNWWLPGRPIPHERPFPADDTRGENLSGKPRGSESSYSPVS